MEVFLLLLIIIEGRRLMYVYFEQVFLFEWYMGCCNDGRLDSPLLIDGSCPARRQLPELPSCGARTSLTFHGCVDEIMGLSSPSELLDYETYIDSQYLYRVDGKNSLRGRSSMSADLFAAVTLV